MARAELSPGLDTIRGKLYGPADMQMRIKYYKDDEGHIVKKGPQEYFKRKSRDYKRSPRTAKEEAQAAIWRGICRAASGIVKDKNHPRYAELRARWNAQFQSGGDAFLNEGRMENVTYGMFPVFVRMVLMKERAHKLDR